VVPCPDTLRVTISAIRWVSKTAVWPCGQRHTASLEADIVHIGGATIVGSHSHMSFKNSPIRTQVVAGHALRNLPADDAAEALIFTNGLRETVACGVCGT
jgi:hypothetical protein